MGLSAFRLDGKTAIITGASRGIGAAIATFYNDAGANLVLTSRNPTDMDSLIAGFSGKGKAVACRAHMGDPDQIQSLIDFTIESFGQIDIVVNNAATNPLYGPIQDTDMDAFDKVFEVNVKGPLCLANLAYPHLKRTKGNVINVSSIGGIQPERGLGVYNMSKATLISMSKSMAREWGRDEIRVNAICPGLVKTKFSHALMSSEKTLKYIMARQALPLVAEPEHIAGLALFLASDAGAFCTGSVYIADGGFTN